MTRAFPISFLRRPSRTADGAAKRSRSSSADLESVSPRRFHAACVKGPEMGVSIGGPKPVGTRSVNPRSKLSIDGTEEIQHEREAAQSARFDRVVCCGGYLPRRHIRRCDGAKLQRETAGCRGEE